MEIKYESLSTYLTLAKKIINKFAPRFIVQTMLKDEDAISDVAVAIMNADKNFDPNRTGTNNMKKTLYSYRNQCGLWAIKTYVTKQYQSKKLNSLDYAINEENSLYSTIQDNKNNNPLDIIIQSEEENNLNNDISFILDSSILTDKQKDQIKMYYFENKSLAEIGKCYGVTREAIRQSIKRAITNIKTLV